jgi:hypothetical protein
MPKRNHVCPVSREQFRARAKPVKVVIDGKEHAAEIKEFSTRSVTWFINGRVNVEIDWGCVPFRVGLNLTAAVSASCRGPGRPLGEVAASRHRSVACETQAPHFTEDVTSQS